MMRRSYWLGMGILTLLVLIIYCWPAVIGQPTPKLTRGWYLLRAFKLDWLPEQGPRDYSYISSELETHLGIRFLDPQSWAQLQNKDLLEMKNTPQEHVALLAALGENVAILKESTARLRFSVRFGNRVYGLVEYIEHNAVEPRHPLPHRHRTTFAYGASFVDWVEYTYLEGIGPNVSEERSLHRLFVAQYITAVDPLTGTGGPRMISMPYRAWPALLALVLIPYTFIFLLRRPFGRAIAGLIPQRRRARG